MLLQEVGQRCEDLDHEATVRFHLTERERAIVQCLSKGLTNKEIAATLNLALPTVKEHMGHIMEKTHTTTRTGMLMRLLRQ